MRTNRISVEAVSAAPPERVWELLADVTTWTAWAPFDGADLEEPGDRRPEGVGAVRRFRAGGVTTRERVLVSEAPVRFACELVSGLAVRGYRTEVTLRRLGNGGTRIGWESGFRAKLPGTGAAMCRKLEAVARDAAEGLAREAEQRLPVSGSAAAVRNA